MHDKPSPNGSQSLITEPFIPRSQSRIFRPGAIDSTEAGAWDGAFGGLVMRGLHFWLIGLLLLSFTPTASATVYTYSYTGTVDASNAPFEAVLSYDADLVIG